MKKNIFNKNTSLQSTTTAAASVATIAAKRKKKENQTEGKKKRMNESQTGKNKSGRNIHDVAHTITIIIESK